jgi:hypothetical protein
MMIKVGCLPVNQFIMQLKACSAAHESKTKLGHLHNENDVTRQ